MWTFQGERVLDLCYSNITDAFCGSFVLTALTFFSGHNPTAAHNGWRTPSHKSSAPYHVLTGTSSTNRAVIMDFINFCINTTIPLKLIKKHEAFRLNSSGLVSGGQTATSKTRFLKLKFKDKLEHEFGNMNTKQAFQMVKSLTGCEPEHSPSTSTDTEPLHS